MSTFTSNTKWKPTIKRVLITLLVASLFIVGADVLLGVLLRHIPGTFPDILAGQESQGIIKMWQLDAAGIAPIVVTGSSQMQTGFTPPEFDALVKTLSGMSVASVNVSVRGAAIQVSHALIQDFLLPQGIHTIIYGVEMRTLHTGSATIDKWQTDLQGSVLGYDLQQPGPLNRSILLWLLRYSTFVQYQNNLYTWFAGGSFSPPVYLYPVDDYGHWNLTGISDRDLGVIKREFAPFETDNTLQTTFKSTLLSCQQARTRCIVVNMPIHSDANQLISDQDEALYREILLQTGKQAGVPIWDFNTKACQTYFDDSDFFDLNHLNDNGSRRLTDGLAELYVQQVMGKDAQPPNCVKVIQP